MGDFFHAVQNLLVALLRHHPLLGIAPAALAAEKLLKNVLKPQLRAPAEALGKGQGDGVAVVDLREHVGVLAVHDVSAEHAREHVAGQHCALACAAAGNHVVRGLGVEQDGGQQAVHHVGQLSLVLGGVHTVVVNRVAHGLHDLFQVVADHFILGGLAVFVD